jgi:pimeloyl-ACP methyl ester carboxylesterase
MALIEDRVFGMAGTFPPRSLPTRASTSFDLLGITVEGAQVAYAQEGRLALPPLLFLHGWGASHKVWRHAFSAFSPHRRCIAPDLTGFGLSEKPARDYSIEALTEWVGKFLDALGLPRVTLVGHSMGGTIALLFALNHPERVERLAVANPLVVGETAFTARTRFCLAPGIRRALFTLSRWRPLRRWVTKDFSHVQRLDDELAEDLTRSTYRSAIDSMNSLRRIDLRSRLGTLTPPTLAIGADHDRIVAPDQYTLVPARKKICIAETGHMPMVERPAEFNRILDEFLRL